MTEFNLDDTIIFLIEDLVQLAEGTFAENLREALLAEAKEILKGEYGE